MALAINIAMDKTKCFGDFLDTLTFFDLSVLSDAAYDNWWAQVNAGGTNIRVYDYSGAKRHSGTPLYFSKASKRGILVFCSDTTSAENLGYKLVAGLLETDNIQTVLDLNSVSMFLDTTVASGDIVDKTNRALNWEPYGATTTNVLYREAGPLGVSLALGRGTSYTTSGNIRSKTNDTFNREYNQQHSFLCMTKRYAYAGKEELIFKTVVAGAGPGIWFEYGSGGAINAYIQNSGTRNNTLYSAAGVASNTNWHVVGYSYAGTGIELDSRLFYDGPISNTTAGYGLSETIISGGPAMIGFDTTGNLGPDGWFSFPMLFSKQIFGDQVKTLSNMMLSNSTFWTLGGVSNFSTGGGQSRLGIGFPRIGL